MYFRNSLFLFLSLFGVTAYGGSWTQLGGRPGHNSVATLAPLPLSPIWQALPNVDEKFVPYQTPVAHGGRVFVVSRIFVGAMHTSNQLSAFRRDTGSRLWTRSLKKDALDSWSTCAYDTRNQRVVVATGDDLVATEAASGAPCWNAPLGENVVNASPTITEDLLVSGVPANRAMITTFDPNGPAMLAGINLDPYEATINPYDPGEQAWKVTGLAFAGNTAAYLSGLAVVTTSDGWILAFDAYDGGAVWQTYVGGRFFGGVTLRCGYAYAADYEFFGGQNNSTLYKFDLSDGSMVWSTACERTNSAPIVAAGRVYVAGGIRGFGSVIKVQAFEDFGTTVCPLWDTHVDTAGALRVGGWSTQPLYCAGRLYVGSPPASGSPFEPYAALYVINTALTPYDSGFVLTTQLGSGGSPSLLDGRLFSIGSNGLFAFSPTPHTGSGLLNVEDVRILD